MKNFFKHIIPIIALVFFVFIMLSGNYLKKPRDTSEDVLNYINITIEDIKKEDWDNAKNNTIKLEKAWNKIVPRIQFSVDINEIYNININIARLKTSIMTKDKVTSLIELTETIENWKELSK